MKNVRGLLRPSVLRFLSRLIVVSAFGVSGVAHGLGSTPFGAPAGASSAASLKADAAMTSCSYVPSSTAIPYRGASEPLTGTVNPDGAYGCLYLDGALLFCNNIYSTPEPNTILWGHLGTGVGPHTLAVSAVQDGPSLCSFTFTNLPPQGIPTLSEWAMIVLAALLAIGAYAALRRRT